jgi:hypothetical protein
MFIFNINSITYAVFVWLRILGTIIAHPYPHMNSNIQNFGRFEKINLRGD